MQVGEPGTVAKAPLSHTQARVWFLQHVDPTGAAYNVAAIWHVDGPLDVAALRAALVRQGVHLHEPGAAATRAAE